MSKENPIVARKPENHPKAKRKFAAFSDTEKDIIKDSTFELKGPVFLSKKYNVKESYIYSVLKEAGLTAPPNRFCKEYPRRLQGMSLFEYTEIQIEYDKKQKNVKQENFLKRGKKPVEFKNNKNMEGFPVRTEEMTDDDFELVLISSLPL